MPLTLRSRFPGSPGPRNISRTVGGEAKWFSGVMHNHATYSGVGAPSGTTRPDPSFVQSLRVQVSMWDLDSARIVTTRETLTRRYLASVDAQVPIQHDKIPQLIRSLTPSWGWREDCAALCVALLSAACIGTSLNVLFGSVLGGYLAVALAAVVAGLVGASIPVVLRRVLLQSSRARADAAARLLDAQLPRAEAFGGR